MFEHLFSRGGLSIERLRSFVDVAEKGAIARVADGDPSRQSLISRQIGELEEFFGTELTRRKGKGLELTEAGHELARLARLHFQGLADFRSQCAEAPLEFRIAGGNSILEWLLVPAMGEILPAVPGARFALLDWRTGDVVRGLLDHTVDIGIVRRSAIVKPLRFRALGTLGYRVFVPSKLARVGDPPLAISIGSEFLRSFEEASARSGVEPNISIRCTSFTQAAQLVRSGICAAVLPEIAAPFLPGNVQVRDLPWTRTIRRDLGLAWHRRLPEVRPAARSILDVMSRLLALPPGRGKEPTGPPKA